MESTTRHEQYLSLMFKQYFGEKTMTDVFIKYNFMFFFLFCSLTIGIPISCKKIAYDRKGKLVIFKNKIYNFTTFHLMITKKGIMVSLLLNANVKCHFLMTT